MPTWLIVVLVVLVVLVVALALGGAMAVARRERAGRRPFAKRLGEADRALAAALAEDRGWAPELLDAAVRREWAARRPGVRIRALSLVQVIDRPGTDEDRARFRVETEEGPAGLTLRRRGSEWHGEDDDDPGHPPLAA